MDSYYKAITSRNIGIVSESEQARLYNSCIGIAGVGGVGGLLAERLIRMGVGRLKITDPGTFQATDFNRQFGSSVNTLGRNKAEVVFEQLRNINPVSQIIWSNTGITSPEDADSFVSDCDLVIDEMDITVLKESIFLQRAARRKGLFYLFSSAMGYGALTAVFDPQGMTLEEYNSLSPDMDLSQTDRLILPVDKAVPVMPSYINDIAANVDIQKILAGELPAPVTSIGVGLSSSMAVNEAIKIILKKGDIITAPEFIYVDLFDRKFMVGTCQNKQQV